MKKIQLAIVLTLSILAISALTSCEKKYDAETVRDISILQENQNQYDLTFLQIADMLDEYIYVKGKKYKRGTDKYYDFLKDAIASDQELREIPEWNAVKLFVLLYGNETGHIKDMELDENRLPERMTGLSIAEYAEERGLSPEELLSAE